MRMMRLSGSGLVVLALVVLTNGTALRAEDNPEKQALALNEVSGDKALEGKLKALLNDKDGTPKLLAAAAKLVMGKDQPFNVNATYLLAVSAYSLKDYPVSETFFRINARQTVLLSNPKKIAQAYLGLLSSLSVRKNFDFAACEKVYKEFLELKVDDETKDELELYRPMIRRQMAVILLRKGENEKAVALMDKVIEDQPGNPINYIAKARILREIDQSDKAAKILEEVLAAIAKEKSLTEKDRDELSDDIRYYLSGVYIDLKQVDKAAEQLQTLLKRKPDDATYNNDLGYIWADHDMKLPEAEKLIRKALEEDRKERQKEDPKDDKDNPAFLDSMGWVLYKQGKFKEAKEFLLKSLEQPDGQHTEIYDHLAETCLKLGEKNEALAAWKKGIEVAGETRREQLYKEKIEKKVKAQTEQK
jgi:tetratricopeptide (TPR) repeat protein